MTKTYLDYIFGRGGFTCKDAIHSGISCHQFLFGKFLKTFRDSFKLQVFAYLAPNLVMKRKQLRENLKATLRDIFVNFFRAVLYVNLAVTVPWALCCSYSHLFGAFTNKQTLPVQLGYSIGMLAIMIEPVTKHSQYVGFYMPKALEMLTKYLQKNKLIPKAKGTEWIVILVVCGLIGVAHCRGHFQKKLNQESQVLAQGNVIFTSPFSWLWN